MKRRVLFCLVVVLFLAGCQAQEPAGQQHNANVEQEVLPTPSSRGPDGPPSVRGPDGPPPGTEFAEEDTPQSMTETETVEYTLPESDEAEFKIQ